MPESEENEIYDQAALLNFFPLPPMWGPSKPETAHMALMLPGEGLLVGDPIPNVAYYTPDRKYDEGFVSYLRRLHQEGKSYFIYTDMRDRHPITHELLDIE